MRIVDCKQGSPEWWTARRGIPTASSFDRIITPKTAKLSSGADDYICELIADLHALQRIEPYQNRAMAAGVETEPEARKWYALETGNIVQEVGFCLSDDGRFGCSPDGLIDEDADDNREEASRYESGGLELKCPTLKVQVKYLLAGTLPDEYKPQVHGNLLVTGRAWWDFLSYSPGLPPLLVRVVPDEYTKALVDALEVFWLRFQALKAKIEDEGGLEDK